MSAREPRPLRRFVVHSRGRYDLIAVERVVGITATSGRGVTLHTAAGAWRMRASLRQLEQRLDPGLFLRVHRSAIANLAFVQRVHFEGGLGTLLLRETDLRLSVGRDRIAALRGALGASADGSDLAARAVRPHVDAVPSNVRFAVPSKGGMELLETASVDYVTIDGNYTVFHCARREVRARSALSLVERLLRGCGFARISRSALVNLHRVAAVKIDVHSEYTLVLTAGPRLRVGRRFRDRLGSLLDGAV